MSRGGRRAAGSGVQRARQQGDRGQGAGQRARTRSTVSHPPPRRKNGGICAAVGARASGSQCNSELGERKPRAIVTPGEPVRSAVTSKFPGRSAYGAQAASTCAEAGASGIGGGSGSCQSSVTTRIRSVPAVNETLMADARRTAGCPRKEGVKLPWCRGRRTRSLNTAEMKVACLRDASIACQYGVVAGRRCLPGHSRTQAAR
jgi:hypothetical protein